MKVAKVEGSANGHRAIVEGTDYEIVLEKLDYKDDHEVNLWYDVMNLEEFKVKLLKKNNIWVIYHFDRAYYEDIKRNKQRYEDIVCGFLQYYDREVRNGMTDHSIYFHWGNWKDKSDCVVIFINEPPLRFPVKNPISYYAEAGQKPDSYFERKNYNTTPYYKGTDEIEPPPNAGLSDPPKPPPPPPPPPY